MLLANEKIKLGSSQLKLKAVLSFAIRQQQQDTCKNLSYLDPLFREAATYSRNEWAPFSLRRRTVILTIK